MKMLKIKADNMRDALAEVRKQLGEDAVVLHTKQYEEPSTLGLRTKRGVEILAAAGSERQISPAAIESTPTSVTGADGSQLQNIERQVEDIRRTLAELMSGMVIAQKRELTPSMERLVRNGVSESLAEMVLQNCGDKAADILAALGRRLRCTGEVDLRRGQTRVALVGPTGVGKTTTAAKIAAQYSIFRKKSVAMITLDTYRVGAVEQLAAYARILNVPLEVALSPEDGEALVSKHADKDLIVIDTVGRSQRNRDHILELSSFLKACSPTEVHLTLSASADRVAHTEAVEGFGPLHPDRVILTKLDECAAPGTVLELAASSLMPYSYVTFGQDVPDDISVAEREMLARFVWEGAL